MDSETLNKARYAKYEKIRNECGLKDIQVSEKAGVAPSTISDWKNGRATPAFGNIVKIAGVLNVSANEFEVEGG